MNPLQLMQMLRNRNPQQLMSMLEQQMQGNPMGENMLKLARNHDVAGLEQLARNYMKSQGKDFDKEFASFKKQMGL